jgi:hypothetical protein
VDRPRQSRSATYRPGTDLCRCHPIREHQRLSRADEVAALHVTARHVEQIARAALRREPLEVGPRREALMFAGLHNLTELDRRRYPRQVNGGWAHSCVEVRWGR